MGLSRLTHQVHIISTALGSYHLERGRKKMRERKGGKKRGMQRGREEEERKRGMKRKVLDGY